LKYGLILALPVAVLLKKAGSTAIGLITSALVATAIGIKEELSAAVKEATEVFSSPPENPVPTAKLLEPPLGMGLVEAKLEFHLETAHVNTVGNSDDAGDGDDVDDDGDSSDDKGKDDKGKEDKGKEDKGKEDKGKEGKGKDGKGKDDKGKDDKGKDEKGNDDTENGAVL
jgi:hypothetical protein